MPSFTVSRAPVIRAEIRVPGDKSISHRAVMLASLSNGVCVIRGFLPGEDCLATVNAFRALGVQIEHPEPTTLVVHGARRRLVAPEGPVACGNSGTTLRLLAGLLAGQPEPFAARLTGDASLSNRPMRRILEPLAAMGARLTAEGSDGRPPLLVEGAPDGLRGIEYVLPVASAQVKSAVLLAGLFAEGRTTVIEITPTRDHTERLLQHYQVPFRAEEIVLEEGQRARRLTVEGGATPESRDFHVPGDLSAAAFWMAAAAAQPGARLLVQDVGLNETRTGLLAVLVRMGAEVREIVGEMGGGERMGAVEIAGTELRGTVVEGAEIANVIDELPIIAVLGALARGETVIRDAAELRVKETDRLAALAAVLSALGATVEEKPDGLVIQGGHALRGAVLPSFGDHRIAMAGAIAGLFADGETTIEGAECIATSYPGFEEALRALAEGARAPGRATTVVPAMPG